jgi:hypothetical protein
LINIPRAAGDRLRSLVSTFQRFEKPPICERTGTPRKMVFAKVRAPQEFAETERELGLARDQVLDGERAAAQVKSQAMSASRLTHIRP